MARSAVKPASDTMYAAVERRMSLVKILMTAGTSSLLSSSCKRIHTHKALSYSVQVERWYRHKLAEVYVILATSKWINAKRPTAAAGFVAMFALVVRRVRQCWFPCLQLTTLSYSSLFSATAEQDHGNHRASICFFAGRQLDH